MGVGAAFVMPATLSVITSSFPEQERARAVGIWVGVAGGGAVLGLFATGLLLEWFAWNSFFALNVTLAAVALAGTVAFVPSSRDEHPPTIDPLSAMLSLLGIGGLVFGIIEGATKGWSDPIVVIPLIVGAVSLVTFVLVQLRKAAPLLDPRLFTDRGFGIGSLSVTAQFFAAFGFFFIVMQYLQYVNGYSALGAAVALLPMPLFLLPTARISPRIADRFGFAVVGAVGLTCIAVGFGIIASLGTDLVYWRFAVGVAVFAIGMGLAGTPATTAITAALPRAKQGVASAVNDTAREVGSAFGIAVLGSTLNSAYRDGMAAVAAALPPQAAEGVMNSIAFVVRLPVEQMGDRGTQLVAQAKEAFADGVQQASVVAGVALILTALAVLLLGPRRRHGQP
jgi:MFS family permease